MKVSTSQHVSHFRAGCNKDETKKSNSNSRWPDSKFCPSQLFSTEKEYVKNTRMSFYIWSDTTVHMGIPTIPTILCRYMVMCHMTIYQIEKERAKTFESWLTIIDTKTSDFMQIKTQSYTMRLFSGFNMLVFTFLKLGGFQRSLPGCQDLKENLFIWMKCAHGATASEQRVTVWLIYNKKSTKTIKKKKDFYNPTTIKSTPEQCILRPLRDLCPPFNRPCSYHIFPPAPRWGRWYILPAPGTFM